MKIDRRQFLKIGAAGAVSTMAADRKARKPNILVILADDMGYSDAGCYGGDIETPNLDRLAANGLRFTQAYSTARCGPSRGCILTGYYAQQTAGDVMTPGNIPAWTKFVPEYLKPLGYRSYHSGKWHIRFKPLAGARFDHSYTLLDQNRFFTPTAHLLDDERLRAVKKGDGYYATIAIADHAVKTLQQHAREYAGDPFFHYLAFTSPHFPLQALQEDIDKYHDRFSEGWDTSRERRWQRMRRMGLINCGLSPLEPDMRPQWNTPDQELMEKIGAGEVTRAVPWSTLTAEQKKLQRVKMAIHAAMITRMDHEIGRVVDQLKAMDAYRDTVILFISDNGASSEQLIRADGHDASAAPGSAATHLCLGSGWASAANAPFRLHKSWVHEGGISSPLIAHWPNGITDHGKLRHNPCHFIDLLPTMMELGGGKPLQTDASAPPLAGKSLVKAFAKDGAVQRDFLYFNHSNNRAIRMGDWKLVAAGKTGPWALHDLRSDRTEGKDLSSSQPARVAEMSALWTSKDEEFVRVREAAPASSKEKLR
ncbi:MAG TPA: sulfatase-like hydrolase/transferase [Bryobacteraceae bacterium]|nr:sulfatase-like hydrolase/transferase [Bryobacteraceae bacterium]